MGLTGTVVKITVQDRMATDVLFLEALDNGDVFSTMGRPGDYFQRLPVVVDSGGGLAVVTLQGGDVLWLDPRLIVDRIFDMDVTLKERTEGSV